MSRRRDECWTLKNVVELITTKHLRKYLTEKGKKIAAEADKNLKTNNRGPVATTKEETNNKYDRQWVKNLRINKLSCQKGKSGRPLASTVSKMDPLEMYIQLHLRKKKHGKSRHRTLTHW